MALQGAAVLLLLLLLLLPHAPERGPEALQLPGPDGGVHVHPILVLVLLRARVAVELLDDVGRAAQGARAAAAGRVVPAVRTHRT